MTIPAFEGIEKQLVPEILPLSDLRNFWKIAEEPIPHVFQEGLALGTFGVLASEPGLGKSYMALAVGLSVALNRVLVCGFTPVQSGRVHFLFAEDDDHAVSQRLRAICESMNIEEADIIVAMTDGRLSFVCGQAAALLHFEPGGTARRSAAYELVEKRCIEEEYRLVIVDPLIAWAGCPNENDNAQVQLVSKALIDLAKACGGSVLCLHHVNKTGARGNEANQSAVRGGSSLLGAARWGGMLRGFTETEYKEYSISKERAGEFVQFNQIKNQYRPLDRQTIVFQRGAGGVLRPMDLKPTRIPKLLDVIVAQLRAKPVALTAREMYKTDGAPASS